MKCADTQFIVHVFACCRHPDPGETISTMIRIGPNRFKLNYEPATANHASPFFSFKARPHTGGTLKKFFSRQMRLAPNRAAAAPFVR